ncbi:accessory Sec system protein Asp2 [Gemelliphila palaticanis]|uniref:Accessory Sec system protein Asp2 n=1 Tax=Gemelliphila palaticanis TaxID=81950 RepID=A0ABX2T327_9BACL|nr:accessory Sec system protein Asp2 [Gemella palaticanis]MBF0716097.1 accessory Sec system protein Asp2 [Gemella palaticanis]NYS48027.1 accessory Sec system protein Asp2 [Gemella palaticanis]
MKKLLYIANNKWKEFEEHNLEKFKVTYIHYNDLSKLNIYKEIKVLNKEKNVLESKKKKISFNTIVIEDINLINEEGLSILSEISKPYSIIYNHSGSEIKNLFSEYMKKYIPFQSDFKEKDKLIKDIYKCFFKSQYGDRVLVRDLIVSPNFSGDIEFLGNSYLKLSGEFGNDFIQLASWKINKIAYKDSVIEFWPEFIKDDTVDIEYKIRSITEGSIDDICSELTISEENLQDKIYIENDVNTYFHISVHLKGRGNCKIGIGHYRFSRKDYGNMTLGAERLVDEDTREEILFYFDPANLKPPLNVYFSGYRTQEGFEGYSMIKNLGSSFILITDPRLEGGAFYFASEKLESMVLDKIKEKLNYLNFTNEQLILSGLSMGTFGALYYGSRLSPYGIVLGLPLASIGNIAKNLKLLAPDVFPTSLDVLRHYTGKLGESSADLLNRRFWNIFEKSNLDNTTIIASYMKDDDYDRTAYYDIVESLKGKKTIVIGRGLEGRHMDASSNINSWFIMKYRELIKKGFGKNYDE